MPLDEPPPSTDPLPSRHLWLADLGWEQRYRVFERLGAGGMGQVWRAEEISTSSAPRNVAIKILDPTRAGDEHLLARLDTEAAALATLRDAGHHEGIVPILDFAITETTAGLVMEYIPGQDLRSWCETHRLELRRRVELLTKAAHAAGWCHQHNIVHRDLKPANILVHSATGEPVLVDFSIAKLDELLPLTLTGEALGTAPYMAPEQIDRRLAPVTPATDVYSLGSTLYELLTHVHPHPGDFTQIVRRHAEEIQPAPPSALNPQIPRDLECVLLKALSHRPAERYENGAALAADLDRFLAGEPVLARPVSHLTRAFRRARRKPALTAALAACLALGAFILWSVPRQTAQRNRFALQSRLTNAMQQSPWDLQKLAEAEANLTALRDYNVPLAEQLRQRLYDDVSRDSEVRLQQKLLRDEDYTWLRAMAGWLQTRQPAEARRLSDLISERAGRWEILAEVKAPFTDKQGLFPVSRLKVATEGEGLLYPLYDPGEMPNITVTKSVSVPMELDATFVAEAASYETLTLVYYNQGTRLAAGLYKVRHLSQNVIQKMPVISPDPESYVLVLKLNNEDNLLSHIPETDLLSQPFRLTVRVEREWAVFELNGGPQLRVEAPFSFGSGRVDNLWRITWPEQVGLKHLALRSRRADVASPLEAADLEAIHQRFAHAIRLYEELRGDPQCGIEASYKSAQCYLRIGDHAAAMRLWESIAEGPPSDWQDRSRIQLWVQSVITQQPDSPRHLARLPDPLPDRLFTKLTPADIDQLTYWYAAFGMNAALPRVDSEGLMEATKALRILRTSPVQIANRFALAHHSARLEKEAHNLYQDGLYDALTSRLTPEDLVALTNCLDQWCRISPSETRQDQTTMLRLWEKKRRTDPTVQAIWHMENARIAARAGQLHAAITSIQKAREIPAKGMDDRLQTSLWLLAGTLYHLQGTQDRAQDGWLKGIAIARTVNFRHPLHLMDNVMLHCLTRSWDLQRLGDILPDLLTKHLRSQERTAAKVAIHQTFLTDPAWITTFNHVLHSERGQAFTQDYVFCRQPPRELTLQFYRLLFEQHFRTTAYPQGTVDQLRLVRRIVDNLVTEMAMNPRLTMSHLHSYLRAWADPTAPASNDYPCSPALLSGMTSLLAQRHSTPDPNSAPPEQETK